MGKVVTAIEVASGPSFCGTLNIELVTFAHKVHLLSVRAFGQ